MSLSRVRELERDSGSARLLREPCLKSDRTGFTKLFIFHLTRNSRYRLENSFLGKTIYRTLPLLSINRQKCSQLVGYKSRSPRWCPRLQNGDSRGEFRDEFRGEKSWFPLFRKRKNLHGLESRQRENEKRKENYRSLTIIRNIFEKMVVKFRGKSVLRQDRSKTMEHDGKLANPT